jgi:iron transport multicopper oxidase
MLDFSRLALAAFATALSAAALSQAANVTLDWNVGWVPDQNPDGLYVRRAIGVNGQFPPPIIVSGE